MEPSLHREVKHAAIDLDIDNSTFLRRWAKAGIWLCKNISGPQASNLRLSLKVETDDPEIIPQLYLDTAKNHYCHRYLQLADMFDALIETIDVLESKKEGR